MQLDKQAETWRDANEEAIKNVARLVYGPKEDYEQEFQHLALTITNTKKNPWSYMPVGWENVLGCAQYYESFLSQLHHAMCDDGDVCFVDVGIYGSIMVFHNRHDKDLIDKVVKERFKSTFIHNEVDWFIYTNVTKFIQSIQEK